ncbi:hypothetical protein M8C21_018458 [Ambrosia artemisiifolia]|uniref:Uncharacterized protein n=1 Tax=Ambrosia artemisiifolia TaxID=4212 RepID=A0AAD5G9C3_AMBAR|nr:hypothetical protein M8C21_018458 [Ambrosia artemisiifolia]
MMPISKAFFLDLDSGWKGYGILEGTLTYVKSLLKKMDSLNEIVLNICFGH